MKENHSFICDPCLHDEALLEHASQSYPCAQCERSTTPNTNTAFGPSIHDMHFACSAHIAKLLISDIGNGAHTTVSGTDEKDTASRYFKFAQKDAQAILVCIILRCSAPGFNEKPYYELHILDNINGGNGTLMDVEEMSVESVTKALEKIQATTIANAKTPVSQVALRMYLVQSRSPEGAVSSSLRTAQGIINLLGFRDCCGYEYEIYDIHHYGSVIKLIERHDNEIHAPNYHSLWYPEEYGGELAFSGFSPEH